LYDEQSNIISFQSIAMGDNLTCRAI